jgi:hypothetical protein
MSLRKIKVAIAQRAVRIPRYENKGVEEISAILKIPDYVINRILKSVDGD